MTTHRLERPISLIPTAKAEPAEPVWPRKFRRDIEGLRAVAILLVVLYHAGVSQLPGGFVGVDVFFVISGYLITLHLVQEAEQDGRIRFARFYARRARRLLPLGALVLILTVGASWFLTSNLDTNQVAEDAVWTALFAINFRLAASGVDYQANQDPSPLQHYWSLAVEEQFYLLWPAILAILLFAAFKLRASGRVSLSVVGFGIAVLFAASLWFSIVKTQTQAVSAFFLPTTRAWELALGGLVAVSAGWLARRRAIQNGVMAALGLAMIGVAAALFTEEAPFPGSWALVPAVGSAMVIAGGLGAAHAVERGILGLGPMQLIGRLSYGWYLWHWPILVLAAVVWEKQPTLEQGLVLAAISLWLAACSYIAVENPFRTMPVVAGRPRNGLFVGLSCVGLSLVVAVAALYATTTTRGSGTAAEVSGVALIPAVVGAARGGGEVPGNLKPTLDGADKDIPSLHTPGGDACHAGLLSAELGGDCVVGGTDAGTKTVIVTGDSHAFQWLPTLEVIAKEQNWRLINLTKSACPLYTFTLVNAQLERDYQECYDWRDRVFERIVAEQPDMVVTSAAVFSPKGDSFTARWGKGVTSTVEQLKGTGAAVVVLEDTPFPAPTFPNVWRRTWRASVSATWGCNDPRAIQPDGRSPRTPPVPPAP